MVDFFFQILQKVPQNCNFDFVLILFIVNFE